MSTSDRFTVFERWFWGTMLALSFTALVYALATDPGPRPTEPMPAEPAVEK